MATVTDFRDLLVWRRSHQFVLDIYGASGSFPKSEQFGLTGQLRRAAVSIMSNIAEGFGRASNNDFYRFLVIARGSVSEVQAQLLISRDLGFLSDNLYDKLYGESVEIHKMLNKFMKSLKTHRPPN